MLYMLNIYMYEGIWWEFVRHVISYKGVTRSQVHAPTNIKIYFLPYTKGMFGFRKRWKKYEESEEEMKEELEEVSSSLHEFVRPNLRILKRDGMFWFKNSSFAWKSTLPLSFCLSKVAVREGEWREIRCFD